MVVAVAAKSREPESEVYSRFCTAKCFHLYDTETNRVEVIENHIENAAGRKVETIAAGLIMEKGADLVLAGVCGPTAYRCLNAAGIQLIAAVHGKVNDVMHSMHFHDDDLVLCDEDECPICRQAGSDWNWK
jgi:predicted Fe-Mo cluster-binding NifX family protein